MSGKVALMFVAGCVTVLLAAVVIAFGPKWAEQRALEAKPTCIGQNITQAEADAAGCRLR